MILESNDNQIDYVIIKKLIIFRFFTETKDYLPLFYALTWPCSKNNNDLMIEDILPLKIACHFPRNTLLHLAAKGLKKDSVEKILNHALELRIENILALQGGE